jgi:hypothetical protein
MWGGLGAVIFRSVPSSPLRTHPVVRLENPTIQENWHWQRTLRSFQGAAAAFSTHAISMALYGQVPPAMAIFH